MFISQIDVLISRYITRGEDLNNLHNVQELLKEDLREDVPFNVINFSINRVQRCR